MLMVNAQSNVYKLLILSKTQILLIYIINEKEKANQTIQDSLQDSCEKLHSQVNLINMRMTAHSQAGRTCQRSILTLKMAWQHNVIVEQVKHPVGVTSAVINIYSVTGSRLRKGHMQDKPRHVTSVRNNLLIVVGLVQLVWSHVK